MGNGNRDKKAKALVSCVASAALAFSLFAMPAMAFAETNENSTSSGRIIRQMESLERSDSDLDSTLTDDASADEGYPEDSADNGVADDAAIEGEDGSDNSQEEAQTQEDDPSIFDSIFQFFSSLSPFSVTSEDMHDASMRVELLSRVSSAAQASGGDLTLTLRGTTGGGTYSARFNAQATTYENFITDTHSAAGNARVQSQTPVKYIAEIHEIPAGSYNIEVTGTNYGKYTHGGTVTLADGDLADFYLIDSLYPPDGTSAVSLDNRTGLVPYGDFTGDGVINDADSKEIADAVHNGSSDAIYDFTGDGAVDLADVQHFAENVNKSHAATEVRISKDVSQMDSSFNEGTSAGVKPGGTGSAGTDQDKAADSLFYDDGDTIELKHASGIDISEENPVGFTIDSKGVGIGAFAVQFPLDENNKPYFMGDGGRIDLELDDPIAGDNESDKVYKLFADIKEATGNIEDLKPSNDPDEHPYDFMYQRLRAYLFKETGQLVIVFSDEITPVKLRSAKITFTSTTNPTNKTIEISHVEFLNDAADLNLPVFPDAPEVTDVQTGDEMISLAWEGDENALAYDVEVGINNQTDVYTTSARSLTIDSHSTSGSLENDALYSVRVRSIGLKGNSVWSSPVSAVPEDRTAPESIAAPSLSAGYSQITASWDSVDNANSYILYFKKATDENFSSAELEGNSYTVKNLESYTEYEFYLVAENEYGTSEPSEVVRTSTTSAGGKIPWFNLINRASQNSDLYPHVNSFDSVEIDGLDAGTASAVVDGNFDTYVELGRASDQTGGTNATVSATLKEPSDLRSLAFTTYMGEGFSDDVENVYVRVIGEGAGAEGAEGESAGVEGELFTLDSGLSLHSVPSEGGAEGAAVNTVYVELPRTIEGAKTVRVSFTRAGGLPATIAELGLYRPSGLEEEVAGVWADETHVSLRKGMDAAAFDDLEKRIESRDENSAENGHEAEMHPLVSEFRSALSDARQMLDFENPVYMNVNTSISASESSVGGMNAWQPLGLVAKAGEKIKVYVSTPSGNTGEPTKLRLIASQYMGGKDSQFAPVGYLLTGMNELTVPEIGQLPEGSNVERGGALYLEYTGEVGAESYGVNVLGGTRIPVLDLTGLSGTSKQRSERVMQYTMQLEEYVNTLSKVHGDAEHTGTGFLGMFVDSDCFANMTEIVTDHAILTLPATKLVLELSSTDMTEVADRIDAIAQTTDSMFKLAYQHKGLFSVSDNPNLARAYGYDNEIATARHNVRCMDLADGQSACSATNFIGITSDGVSELLKIENIELSSDGSYESGEYLGALVAHALGHQLSDNASAIDEVSANYFTQLLTSHDDNNSVVFDWSDVFNRVTSGALGQLDARLGAAALWQLHLAYDEGFAHAVYDDPDDQMANLIFARINAYARNPECAPYSLSLDDTDTSNKFVRLACAAAKRDLSGFFKAWGVELDSATRAYASNFASEQRQIQYLTDESAKAAHAGVGVGMDLVDASASVSFDKDAQTVTLSNIKAGGASAKNARGFEILRKNDDGDFIPVGFVSAGETTFVESAVSLPENEVQYKVRAIDNAGNASAASDELSVRVERASVAGGVSNFTMPTDKSKWTVTSNMVSVEGESDTADSAGIFGAFACASAPQADLGCTVDGDVKTAFTGNVSNEAMKHQVTIALNDVMDVSGIRYYPLDKESSFRGVDIEVSLNGKDWTLVNTSMLYFPAADNYKGYDAFGRSDNAVIYFTDADAADDASASDMLATYSASFIRLTEWAENANPVSIAEIDVLSTPIYSVSLASEAEHFGMGKLTEDVTLQSSHVEGDDAEAYRQNALSEANSVSIPKGSLVIMGDYTGNPVYNTVVIKDGEGNIIADPSKQIIITNKAGQNDVAIVERAAMVRETMDIFADQVLMSRIQFALTASYHFIFVPITIGIGLLMAIFVTRAYRTKDAEDDALARMWVKIYTATFAIGVATGITMEFSFGTNWANYSRFVGDIFGAPLAAEALFAFFLESIFLGVIIFGRNKIKPILYTISAWLTFAGSALSALWILIANSWMQTPAGAELSADGSQALITDFFAAAFNPSTLPRYCHTVLAVLVMGAFVTIAVAAWYMHKEKFKAAATKMLRTGVVVGILALCALFVSAHASAVEVWEEQPTKLAMMEGQYETEAPELSVVGFVDEQNEEAVTLGIPGGTSFLATGTWDTEYPGLNELARTEQFSVINVDEMPVNFVYQVYHLMVACFGLIGLCLVLALIFMRKKAKHNVSNMRWLQWLLIISPVFPFLAIQSGWLTAEVGRQPYVVYPSVSGPEGIELLTEQGTSVSVQPFELIITLLLFFAVYLILFIGWVRVIGRFIKAGPVYETDSSKDDAEAERLISFSSDMDGADVDDLDKDSRDAIDVVSEEIEKADIADEIIEVEVDDVVLETESQKGGDAK